VSITAFNESLVGFKDDISVQLNGINEHLGKAKADLGSLKLVAAANHLQDAGGFFKTLRSTTTGLKGAFYSSNRLSNIAEILRKLKDLNPSLNDLRGLIGDLDKMIVRPKQ